MAEQVLIEFVADTTALDSTIDKLQKVGVVSEDVANAFKDTGAQGKKGMEAVSKSGDGALKTVKDLQNGVDKMSDSFDDAINAGLNDALKEAGVTLDEFKKKIKLFEGPSVFGTLSTQISDTNKRLLETSARMELLKRNGKIDTSGYKDLEKQLAADKVEAERLSAAMVDVKKNVELKPTGANVALRTQLRNIREELSRLEDAGQANTAQFEKLAIAAGKMQDQMDDTQQRIMVLASDTKYFDAAIQGVRGLTAGFGLAQGAAALFGDENKDLQKTLIKVQSIMLILQSLQELQLILQKQSAAAVVATSAARTVEAAVTNLTAAAYRTLGISVETTSTAFKVLKGALIATGIGALIVGIGLLIANFDKVKDAISGATNASRLAAKVTKDLSAVQLESAKATVKERVELESLVIVAKDESKTKKVRLAAIQAINDKMPEYNGNINLENINTKAVTAQIGNYINSLGKKALAQAYMNKIQDLYNKQIEVENRSLEESVTWYDKLIGSMSTGKALISGDAADEEARKRAKKRRDEEAADIKKQIDLIQQKFSADLKSGKATLDLDQEIAHQEERARKAKEDGDKKAFEIAQRNAKALLEIQKRALQQEADIQKTFADAPDLGQNMRLAALARYYALKEQMLLKDRDAELKQEGLTALEKRNIIEKYQEQANDLYREKSKQRVDIIKSANDQILKDFGSFQVEQDKIIAAIAKNIDDGFGEINKGNKIELNLGLDDLQAQYQKGLITFQDFEDKREYIIKAHQERDNNNEIARLAAQIDNLKRHGKNTEALQDQLNDALAKKRDIDFENFKKNEEKKTEEAKRETEKRKEILFNLMDIIEAGIAAMPDSMVNRTLSALGNLSKVIYQVNEDLKAGIIDNGEAMAKILTATIQTAQGVINGIFQQASQDRQALLQDDLARLDEQKQREIDNKNLTESQKASIEKRYQEKQRQLKQKAAEADKRAQISQAIINGALAITNALATVKPFVPAALIAAGIAAATTGIQIAAIRSTPVPKFKKGGYTGNKHSTEEVGIVHGQEFVAHAPATKKYRPILEAINAMDLDNYLLSITPRVDQKLISNSYVNKSGEVKIDYDKLGEAVASKMPMPVVNNIVMDEDGFTKNIQKNGSKMTIRNKKYKL